MGDKSVPVAKKGGGGAKHTPPHPSNFRHPVKGSNTTQVTFSS